MFRHVLEEEDNTDVESPRQLDQGLRTRSPLPSLELLNLLRGRSDLIRYLISGEAKLGSSFENSLADVFVNAVHNVPQRKPWSSRSSAAPRERLFAPSRRAIVAAVYRPDALDQG